VSELSSSRLDGFPGHFERLESYLPFDLTVFENFFLATLVLSAIVAFRYFLIVTPIWAMLYWHKPTTWAKRQIYETLPSKEMQGFEIKWSVITSLLFGLSGVGLGLIWQLGWTKIYLSFTQYGLWYLPVSFVVMSILHDFYFYITHRWLHLPRVYRKFHSLHHQSLTPSPWASFSFHPVEGFIQALALPLIVLFLPVHPTVLLAYLTFMTVSAIINHLGFEVLPPNRFGKFLGRWLITGTHHAQHHRYFRTNYGLFFTFWDKVFATEDSRYETELQRLAKNDNVQELVPAEDQL
jgi:lathosterol oxidase